MPQVDIQQVCLNGHQITDSYNAAPHTRKNFCTYCGEKTIISCPSCHKNINGHVTYERVISVSITPVPEICEHCGKGFPWIGLRQLVKAARNQEDNELKIKLISDRFHLIAKQLRQRYNDRQTLDISDEYDVQDLYHALLKLFFDDIRPEEWNPSYAGSSTRVDFLLKNEKIIIEIKKTRAGLKAKQLGEQLIIDIAHYKNNADCKLLYCFVYDPESYITNPGGIQNDLSKKENDFKVVVNILQP